MHHNRVERLELLQHLVFGRGATTAHQAIAVTALLQKLESLPGCSPGSADPPRSACGVQRHRPGETLTAAATAARG